MPYQIRYAADGADIQYFGATTGDEILKAKSEFFAHSFRKDARFVMCDFTAVQDFGVTPAQVQQIVDQDRRAVDSHPDLLEVVVAPQAHQYGMARMWEMRVEEVRPSTAVYRTRAEAEAWLERHGVPGQREAES